VVAQYNWTDFGGHTVGKALSDIVLALLPTAQGLLAPAQPGVLGGPYRLQVELVKRSEQSLVVVGGLAPLDGSAADVQRRLFRLDDVTNGSALAQTGDRTGVQCDRMVVQARQPVDFVWVVDSSGSMSNEQSALATAAESMAAQLQASTVDWRIMVLTSDLDDLEDDPLVWEVNTWPNQPSAETCAVPDQPGRFPRGPKYCPFTRDAFSFNLCVASLSICGNGFENFFRPLACLLGGEVNGNFHCGRNAATPPYAGFAPAPSPFGLVPRTALGMETPNQLRSGAKVVVVFLTDTNDQSDGRFPPPDLDNLDGWVSFFQNIDGVPVPGPENRAFMSGIVCPAGQNCSDDTATDRWQRFFSASAGVLAELPADGDPDQQALLQGAVSEILDRAIGQASPYTLTRPPISSTIKVAMEAQTEGPCRAQDIPRSTQHGFDYDGTTRSIVFYGNCRPKASQTGLGISVSYRYWIENSDAPNGTAPPCGGGCPEPFLCNPSTNSCLCPADCGGTAEQPGLRCDTATCRFECPVDCGQTCGLGLSCDTTTCQCVCPEGCNGVSPGAGYACDPVTCQYACPQDCGSSAPGEEWVCNRQSCTWACTPDCNGLCGEGETCNPLSCSCECDINRPCPAGKTLNESTCACACNAAQLECPPTHEANTGVCACACKADCGGCRDDEFCNRSLCECVPQGG
jgi:hypothetical protein